MDDLCKKPVPYHISHLKEANISLRKYTILGLKYLCINLPSAHTDLLWALLCHGEPLQVAPCVWHGSGQRLQREEAHGGSTPHLLRLWQRLSVHVNRYGHSPRDGRWKHGLTDYLTGEQWDQLIDGWCIIRWIDKEFKNNRLRLRVHYSGARRRPL